MGAPRFSVVDIKPESEIEFSVIGQGEDWKVFKIPVFPPHYQWCVRFLTTDGADDCAKTFRGQWRPDIYSVTLKNGVAKKLDMEEFFTRWTPP